MNRAEQAGRDWAYSRWSRASAERRQLPFSEVRKNRVQLALDALKEAILWAAQNGLLASEIAEMEAVAKVRWKELQEGGGQAMPEGKGRCEIIGGRVQRYLGKVE